MCRCLVIKLMVTNYYELALPSRWQNLHLMPWDFHFHSVTEFELTPVNWCLFKTSGLCSWRTWNEHASLLFPLIQSPSSSDPSKKLDISSGTYLQYNALRANRPILPKPVQLTVLESSPSPAAGQPTARETLRGKCDVCNIEFESRAAARDHVFSPRHLATLRTTNFGQSATQINNGSAGIVSQASSSSPASSTS